MTFSVPELWDATHARCSRWWRATKRSLPKSRQTDSRIDDGSIWRGTKALSVGVFILVSAIKSLIVLFVLLTAVAYTVWLERKVVGHMQNRWGPTRVGPFGLLQPAADGLKFLFKEDLTPPHVYKPLFLAAPLIAVILALTSIAVIPFGNWVWVGNQVIPFQITDVNIGVLLILGVTSMGVYGVALAGWASNNKYSLLGGAGGRAATGRCCC